MQNNGVKTLISMAVVVIYLSLASGTGMARIGGGMEKDGCNLKIAGTYLTTIQDSNGTFASRSIVTIDKDGALSVLDSRQSVPNGANIFGAQQGPYRCLGKFLIKAITLNFSYTDDPSIARSDWRFSLTSNGNIEGKITVRFYRPVNSCNPLLPNNGCRVEPFDTFIFKGTKIRL